MITRNLINDPFAYTYKTLFNLTSVSYSIEVYTGECEKKRGCGEKLRFLVYNVSWTDIL